MHNFSRFIFLLLFHDNFSKSLRAFDKFKRTNVSMQKEIHLVLFFSHLSPYQHSTSIYQLTVFLLSKRDVKVSKERQYANYPNCPWGEDFFLYWQRTFWRYLTLSVTQCRNLINFLPLFLAILAVLACENSVHQFLIIMLSISPKLISRKICQIEMILSFHTVRHLH